MTVQNLGAGKAAVTVGDETVTVSEILEKAGPRVYYAGIRELYLVSSYEETVVSLDTALGVQYIYFRSDEGLCLEVANEHGCLTLTDTGGVSVMGVNQHITVRLNPETPPANDICWLVLDATKQPRRVNNGNAEPFVLECNIPGLTNRGIITSMDDLHEGEAGLLLGGLDKPEHATAYTFKTLSVAARLPMGAVPEPASGVLSLLGAASLFARRRRR